MKNENWLEKAIKGVGIGTLLVIMVFFLAFNILFYFGGYFIGSLISGEWLVIFISLEFMTLAWAVVLISMACNGISISLFLFKKSGEP